MTEIEMHVLLQREAPWSGLMRTDVDLTEFSAIQSCFPYLNSVFFYKSVQLCSYFLCNGNLIAAISVGMTLG